MKCKCCDKKISNEEVRKVKNNYKRLFKSMFKKEPTEENWRRYIKSS